MGTRTTAASDVVSTLQWQLAACYLSFTATYLVANIAPYGPFMVLNLLPERSTPENVGKFSAFFTSCLIWGRSSSAGIWGQIADSKGRLPVLYISMVFGAIFTLLFGLCNNYFLALAVRLLLGMFCETSSLLKVCVSEMAGDDRSLEATSMNLVVSAWAFSSLLSPAIGGALADPVKQYPDFPVLQNKIVRGFLLRYRYFLPNLVGAILCLIGLIVIRLFLRETLVVESQQFTSLPPAKRGRTTLPSIQENSEGEKQPLLLKSSALLDFNDSYAISPEAMQLAEEQDMLDTLRDSYMYSDDLQNVMTTAHTRQSMAVSIYRRGTLRQEEHHSSNNQHEEPEPAQITGPPTMKTFLINGNIRNNVLVYCIGCFLIFFQMEAFPLFCLSQNAGLGISESTIGSIMLASGITHALLQPKIYEWIFELAGGLKGSIKWAALGAIPVYFLIPLSLFSEGVGHDHLRWTALTFLGVVIGIGRMFSVTFYSSMSVSLNRLVTPEYRATLNALLTRISGGCKSAAPIFAGFFTAWAFSSGVVPAHGWGAVLLYFTMGLLGILLAAASFLLLGSD